MQVENEYGSYGEDKWLSACHSGIWWRKRRDLSLLHRIHGEQRQEQNPDWRRPLWRETSVPKQPITLGQMKEFLWRNTARNGPWCVWNLDGWFHLLEGTRDSKGPRVSWQKLYMRSWSSAPSISICFMANQFRLHECCLLKYAWRPGISYDYGAFAQWAGQSDEKYYIQKWWRLPLSEYLQEPLPSKSVFARADLHLAN